MALTENGLRIADEKFFVDLVDETYRLATEDPFRLEIDARNTAKTLEEWNRKGKDDHIYLYHEAIGVALVKWQVVYEHALDSYNALYQAGLGSVANEIYSEVKEIKASPQSI